MNNIKISNIEPQNIDLINNETQNINIANSKNITTIAGSSNYEELENKPSINGVELIGNLKTEDLLLLYEKLLSLPKINGITLIGDLTSKDLGIETGGSDINLKTEFDLYGEYEEKDVYNAIAINQLMEIFGFEIMQVMEFVENHEERISALEG